ncbi:LAME_0F15742g1_1 [Lachancea meyersii CBS 8951]|uniref:LAME_0F15742g1_1 n=1 Tax=Lachancea meyersii CBS 8951 TaxID=1266667 RepID=A0A1G4JYN1_9SACH|nr:LAME_0F15742g1_1 [Lachancea meyersii CBS 8951]
MNQSNSEQLIACPVCNVRIKYHLINEHLDKCTARKTGSKKENTLNSLLKGKRKQPEPEEVEIIEPAHEDSRKRARDDSQPPTQHSEQPKKPLVDSNQDVKQLQKIIHQPLSEKLRPKELSEYVGQQHIISSEHGVLYNYVKEGAIPSMILWGPPGVGKTTLARLLTKTVNTKFPHGVTYILVQTSATKATAQELRKIFENSKREFTLTKRLTVLFIDEIHRFNKGQQDILLPHVEAGDVVLIGATTENPSFQLNNALMSRCQIFVLTKLNNAEMCVVLSRGISMLNKCRHLIWKVGHPLRLGKEVLNFIVEISMGDSRRALNLLEMIEVSTRENQRELNEKAVREIIQGNSSELRTYYDRQGENHYDTISAFHKSIRGSDENAALYYLARMLQGGEDPLYIARRMIRIASEDVGVLDHSLLPLAVAAHDAVMKVGLPEADLALAQCSVALARAPKSVQLYRAWKTINTKLRENQDLFASCGIPMHLRNAPTKLMAELGYAKDYKYNPDFKDGKVSQQYFPDEVLEKCGDQGTYFMDGAHLGDREDSDLYREKFS